VGVKKDERWMKYIKRMNFIMSVKIGKLHSKNRRFDIRGAY